MTPDDLPEPVAGGYDQTPPPANGLTLTQEQMDSAGLSGMPAGTMVTLRVTDPAGGLDVESVEPPMDDTAEMEPTPRAKPSIKGPADFGMKTKAPLSPV